MTEARRTRHLNDLMTLRWWRGALLSVGAVVGLLCIVVALAGPILGVKTLVFRSGSMSPAITTGSLAFAKNVPAERLEVGDVASVVNEDGVRVTHRVVEISPSEDGVSLVLKGDANGAVDAGPYLVESADRVLFDVPGVGYVIGAAMSPAGLFVLGLGAAGLLFLIFRPSSGGARRATAAISALTLIGGIVGSGASQSTLAYFTDRATMAGDGLAAHSLAAQAPPNCDNQGGVLGLLGWARLTWPHVDARYEYEWQLRRVSTNALVNSGTVTPTGAGGTTVTLDIGSNLISVGLLSVDFDVIVTARLKSAPQWRAAMTTSTRVHSLNIALVGLSMRCGPKPL